MIGIAIVTALTLYNGYIYALPKQNVFNYAAYLNNDGYWNANKFNFPSVPSADNSNSRVPVRPSEDELTTKRFEALEIQIAVVRHNATNNLALSIIWLLVLVPVFAIHWKIARREQASV
jgi:hypothetical protein